MDEHMRFLTLNCWGVFIPPCTVRKNDRLQAIGEKLAEGFYDVVLLQEIWTDNDYNNLATILNQMYPHSNYYHSNLIGTGLCIFSKWPLECVFTHSYSANGYPHRVDEGDWFCGKGIGFARVTTPKGFRINLYNTHLHARYALDHTQDQYDGHRTSQAIELTEFVRITASSADAIIIAGDFNLEPHTSAIHLFKATLGLSDAWMDNKSVDKSKTASQLELEGCTCDRADNPYRNVKWTEAYVNGERLDYIFYRTGSSELDSNATPPPVSMVCNTCWLDLREVTGESKGLHYSDHEGVAAHFVLTRNSELAGGKHGKSTNLAVHASTEVLEPLLLDAKERIDRGLAQCRTARWRHTRMAVLLGILLILLIVLPAVRGQWIRTVTSSLSALLGACWFMLFWGSVVGRTAERRALENAKQSVTILLSRSNPTHAIDSTKTE